MRRRVLLSLFTPLVAIAAFSSLPASTGCTTHQCDSSCRAVGGDAPPNLGYDCPTDTSDYDSGGPTDVASGNGGTITWESAPFYGHWLDFPGQRQYFLYWPDEVTAFYAAGYGRNQILLVQPYIALTQDNPGWNGIIVGTGQLAEWGPIFNASGQLIGIEISNQSCAEYFLRVVVTITIADPARDQ